MVVGLAQPRIQFASMTLLEKRKCTARNKKDKKKVKKRETGRRKKQYELLSMIFWAAQRVGLS